jgi:hypothetical protein
MLKRKIRKEKINYFFSNAKMLVGLIYGGDL